MLKTGTNIKHSILHAGFSGFQRFVARKISRCKPA